MQKVDFKNGIFKGKPMYLVAILVLAAALILSLLGAVTIGSVDLEVGEVYRVILYKLFGIGDPAVYGSGSMSDIVWFVRLPRLVLAIAIGCSLSIAGVVMQAIVKNPLADPYVLLRCFAGSHPCYPARCRRCIGKWLYRHYGISGCLWCFDGRYLSGKYRRQSQFGQADFGRYGAFLHLLGGVKLCSVCQKQQLRRGERRCPLDDGQPCRRRVGDQRDAFGHIGSFGASTAR